jgi:cytochrome c-type biogenesis protein CcmH/NrfG
LHNFARAHYQTGNLTAAVDAQRRALSLLPPNSSERSKFEKHLAEYEAALADSVKKTPSEATADDAKADEQK